MIVYYITLTGELLDRQLQESIPVPGTGIALLPAPRPCRPFWWPQRWWREPPEAARPPADPKMYVVAGVTHNFERRLPGLEYYSLTDACKPCVFVALRDLTQDQQPSMRSPQANGDAHPDTGKD